MLKKILSFGIALAFSAGVALNVCAVKTPEDGCNSGGSVVEQSNFKDLNLHMLMLKNFFINSSKNTEDKKLKEKFIEVYSEVYYANREGGCFLKFCTKSHKKSYVGSISKTHKDMEQLPKNPCLDFVAMKKPAGSDKISNLCKRFITLSGDYITGGYFIFFENEKWMVACTPYFWNSTSLDICDGRSVMCDFIDEFEKLNEHINLPQTV